VCVCVCVDIATSDSSYVVNGVGVSLRGSVGGP